MKKYIKNLPAYLQELTKEGKIEDRTEDELKAFLQKVLNDFEDGDFNDVHQVKPFKSHIDRIVNGYIEKKKAEIDSRLILKEQEVESLKAQIPRSSNPDEIKKRMEVEKDPSELRFLKLEYDNALLQQRAAQSEAERQRVEKENGMHALKMKLSTVAKEKNLPIADVELFAGLGDSAEETMIKFSEMQNKLIEDRIAQMATKKFGGAPPAGNPGSGSGAMSLEEIAQIPDQATRMEAYKKAGY